MHDQGRARSNPVNTSKADCIDQLPRRSTSGFTRALTHDPQSPRGMVHAVDLRRHAFQKKSKSGIATPKAEIDLVAERINV